MSIGALLGVIFGRALDAQGAAGPVRDAAIASAAYATAEQQLAERLADMQARTGAVLRGMPIAPEMLRRAPGQTL